MNGNGLTAELGQGEAGLGEARFVSVPAAWAAVAVGLVALGTFTALMLTGREPFATYFYLLSWYPVLLAADGVVALLGAAGRRGEFLLLSRPRFALHVLGWSAVIWLFYEAFNFRLQNWYYVNVPASRIVRWGLTIVAFATVLPAVFLSERILGGLGVAARLRWGRLRMTPPRLRALQGLGVAFLVLALGWPRWFFPLVWGGTTLIVEPWVYRRDPARSILGDLERGAPGRLLRLLLGGMAIGLLWECLNINARAKWIYTVPGLEDVKLFEMPVLGFFGFPPFALECFVLWQALVLAGAAVPREADPALPSAPWRRVGGAAVAAAFSILVLVGMDRVRTWDSYRPTLTALGLPASDLVAAGYPDPFALAAATPSAVAAATGAPEPAAREWVEEARLTTLRGIGADNVALLREVGIADVEQLADAAPQALVDTLEAVSPRPIVPARVRVWVRGAQHAVGGTARQP